MARFFTVFIFAFGVIACGIFAASCGNGNAQYRIVNAVSNTTTFDPSGFAIYVNGDSIFSDLAYGETQPSASGKYQSVGGGTDTLTVYPNSAAGQANAQVVQSALNLGGGNQYTVVLTGNSSTSGATFPLAAQVISDPNPTQTTGLTGIRIIDASLNLDSISAGGVDVYVLPSSITTCCAGDGAARVGAAMLYPENGSSGNVSTSYLNIGLPTNGSVRVWLTIANNPSALISEYNYNNVFTLNAEQNYTLVLVDPVGSIGPYLFLTP
jgi:hypothetical protein